MNLFPWDHRQNYFLYVAGIPGVVLTASFIIGWIFYILFRNSDASNDRKFCGVLSCLCSFVSVISAFLWFREYIEMHPIAACLCLGLAVISAIIIILGYIKKTKEIAMIRNENDNVNETNQNNNNRTLKYIAIALLAISLISIIVDAVKLVNRGYWRSALQPVPVIFFALNAILIILLLKNAKKPSIIASIILLALRIILPLYWLAEGDRILLSIWYFIDVAGAVFALLHFLLKEKKPKDMRQTEQQTAQAKNTAIERAEGTNVGMLFTGEIGKLVVLSIVTLGIYGLIWDYRMVKNMRIIEGGDVEDFTGEFLLLILIPFYNIYWFYKHGEAYVNAGRREGYDLENRGTLFLVLSIVGLSIVNMCLMQDDCNKIADGSCRKIAEKPTKTSASETVKQNDSIDALEKLAKLHEQGILTDEEFEQKKAELLAKI